MPWIHYRLVRQDEVKRLGIGGKNHPYLYMLYVMLLEYFFSWLSFYYYFASTKIEQCHLKILINQN